MKTKNQIRKALESLIRNRSLHGSNVPNEVSIRVLQWVLEEENEELIEIA